MNEDDELCLRIGRIARAHVEVDYALRNVYVTLASPGLAVYLANSQNSASRIIEDCSAMLTKAGIPDAVLAAADSALVAAKQAGVVRNRAVHDMWMRDIAEDADPQAWRTYRKNTGGLGSIAPDLPRDLASLDRDHETLLRTRFRVLGLFWALWEVLPFYQGSRPNTEDDQREADVERWVALMEDRFFLNQDGSVVPLGADGQALPQFRPAQEGEDSD